MPVIFSKETFDCSVDNPSADGIEVQVLHFTTLNTSDTEHLQHHSLPMRHFILGQGKNVGCIMDELLHLRNCALSAPEVQMGKGDDTNDWEVRFFSNVQGFAFISRNKSVA